MTLESAAISALGTVTSALVFVCTLLWQEAKECKRWRKKHEPILQSLHHNVGSLSTFAAMVGGCRVEGCYFAGKATETFSIKPDKQAP